MLDSSSRHVFAPAYNLMHLLATNFSFLEAQIGPHDHDGAIAVPPMSER